MMPTTTAITGMAVESIPRPIPEIMTVAAPSCRSHSISGRAVRLGSIVFRGTTDNDAYHQPHNHRAGYPHPVVQLQQPKDKESGNDYQHRTQVRTESKGVQQVLHPGILLGTHGEDAIMERIIPTAAISIGAMTALNCISVSPEWIKAAAPRAAVARMEPQ